MEEIVVATVDSEPVAELIAGRLRIEGIAVRVRYDSLIGMPRQMMTGALGFAAGTFRVSVTAADAGRARAILAAAERIVPTDRTAPRAGLPLRRIVSGLLLAGLLYALVASAVQLVPYLFGR